jgi:L-methionine (R)-S-oxide reductase
MGRGVCGTAAFTKTTQLVPDIDLFPGHIACDGASMSEIVVPVFRAGKKCAKQGEKTNGDEVGEVVAIIDVDCMVKNGFDEVDKRALEELAEVLGRSCDW